MRGIVTSMILCLIGFGVFAQEKTARVTLRVMNEQYAASEGITAELLRGKDTVLMKTSISDRAGLIEFNNVKPGGYFIRLSALSYQTRLTEMFTVDGTHPAVELSSMTLLAASASQMQSVVVAAKKPFIQRLSDRLVVNVESSINNAGSSAFEILERSPMVNIDNNDILSLRGKTGVIIMIDGKVTPMSGQELSSYLRGLPSNAIERIDLITNPSSRYDAAGNAGIIDIRLKKDQRFGSNGSLNASFGQGFYSKATAGGSLNYRNKKLNAFGSYNYAYRKNLNHLFINRNFFENGVFSGSDDKDNFMKANVYSNNIRAGVDYFPSSKTTLGFVINSALTKVNRGSNISTFVKNSQDQPDYYFLSTANNRDHFENGVANVNIKHRFDSLGRELTADIDYGVYHSASLTRTASNFYENSGQPKALDDILDGDQNGSLKLRTAKMDYVNPLPGNSRFETGFKLSYVSSDNDARFFNVLPSSTVVDSGKTNRFFYKEYNSAAYITYFKKMKKLDAQMGLRAEQTNIDTRQVRGNKVNKQDYLRLFPSAFVNYHLKENQTLGLSVSRRIDRPSYSQLNPFLFQIDPSIYSTGNPFLQPQLTWSYEMNYTINNLNFSLGYSHTSQQQNLALSRILDVIPDFVIKPGQSSNITVQIPVNLSSSNHVDFNATIPVKLAKWWNLTNNITAFYNRFNANIGGAKLNSGRPSANYRVTNSFSLSKGWSAELNGQVNTPGRDGYMIYKAQWALSTGVQKIMLKGKGTLRFNMNDIFWTNLPAGRVEYPGRYIENWHAYRDSRVGTLSFTYRFGSNKVLQARRRTTASEEERQRAG